MALVLGEDGPVAVTSSAYAQLREVITQVSRAVEDSTWNNLSRDDAYQQGEGEHEDRRTLIERARVAARRNPLARVAIDLLQHYVLGQGVALKASNRPIVARLVDEFMNDPRNQKVLTSHQAMKEFLETLGTDGDFFIVLYPDDVSGTLQLGTIDALNVIDAIPDPKNAKVTKWYKVRSPSRTYNFGTDSWDINPLGLDSHVYYRDWQNADDAPTGMGGKLQNGLVYQVSIYRRGRFGRSMFATAIDWLNVHKRFVGDRATINQAAAAVAWKKKRTGPASDVANEAGRLRSSLVGNPQRIDTNPPRTAGATIVENQGTSLEWMKTDTGGGAADFDERKLRMMAGAGMGGIPIHYFGDEGNANLATATAMELPMLKAYEDWQKLLGDTLLEVLDFMLSTAHKAGRLGERDDSRKYAEHNTTPQEVMDAPDQTGGQVPMTALQTREAFGAPNQPLPNAPMPGATARLIPRPPVAAPPDPGATEDDPNKPIDWFIDADFPPIVQKDLGIYMAALNTLSTLLPAENIESKKMVVELALMVFGENDLDQALERLFPPNMVAVLPPALPQLPPGPLIDLPKFATSPVAAADKHKIGKMVESDEGDPGDPLALVETISSIRRRRILKAAEDALDAYQVGS